MTSVLHFTCTDDDNGYPSTQNTPCLGKSTRKGKCTTNAGTGSSRILLIISWEDVLNLAYVLLHTQDDHKRRGRLQTHTDMEVTTTRNPNARRCTQELPSCPEQVQNMLQLLPCTHQYEIRLRAKHYATNAAVFCNRCSCSILQVVQGDKHWRNVTERHYVSTYTRQHSWQGSCLPIRSFRCGGSTSWPTRSPIWTPSNAFLWCLAEDKVCVPSVHATLNNWNKNDRKNRRAFVAKCLARSRTSSWRVRGRVGGMKHKLNLYHEWLKSLFSCSSQRRAATTFIPSDFCDRSRHWQSLCAEKWRKGHDNSTLNRNEKIISYRTLHVKSITITKTHYDFVTDKWKHSLQTAWHLIRWCTST